MGQKKEGLYQPHIPIVIKSSNEESNNKTEIIVCNYLSIYIKLKMRRIIRGNYNSNIYIDTVETGLRAKSQTYPPDIVAC